MTQQDDITQRLLTDDEIRDIITGTHQAFGEFKSGYMLVLGRAIESALLSKLRATVADIYVEARECGSCGHVGINDSSDTQAACKNCDWSGDSPKEDHCPGCAQEGTMTAACPKCGSQYSLLADRTISAALASAPVVHPACPTDVCQAAKADGVLCANDECDRASGVRPASAPVAGEAQRPLCLGVVLGMGEYLVQTTAFGEPAQIVFSQASDHDRATRTIGDLKVGGHAPFDHSRIRGQIQFTSPAGLDALEVQLRELRKVHWPETVDAAPQASECECSRKSKAVSDSEAQL